VTVRTESANLSALLAQRQAGVVSLLGGRVLLIVIILVVAFLALYPVGWLVYGSFYSAQPLEDGYLTADNYIRAYSDSYLFDTIKNTFIFAFGQTVVSVGIGTALAWVVARTNTPGRQFFEILVLIVFLLPTLLAVLAWTLLLSPRTGLINTALMSVFRLDSPPFDIFSLQGMIFVQGIYLAPLAYLIIAPAFASIDSSLEESARMSGSSVLQTLRRVTLPLARPAILSAALLMFIVGLESFDIPQLLGAPRRIFTFTSLIFSSIDVFFPPDFGAASALASGLLLTSILFVFFYRRSISQLSRFETIKGKGYRAGVIDIGRWRWLTFGLCMFFFFMTVALPIAVIFIGSFLKFFGRFNMAIFSRMSLDNYERIFNHPQLINGFINSVLLAIFAGGAIVLLAALVSFITIKSKMRGRGALEFIAMLPISFPATVLGVALLWAWITVPGPVFGTILILAVAYATRYLPIGMRTISGGIIQLSNELEEASKMSGASWTYTFRRIILPLVKPALVAAWLMMFLIILRELSMSIILAGPGNPVVSVVMFDYYTSGELGALSATSMLMVVVTITMVVMARKFFNITYTEIRV
jgi:iron(III) transport system permease protein